MYIKGPPVVSIFDFLRKINDINFQDIFIDSITTVFRETKYAIYFDIFTFTYDRAP